MSDTTAELVDRYLTALRGQDTKTVSELFAEDVEIEWPQSGEHFRGKERCLSIFGSYPGGSPKLVGVRRIRAADDLAVAEASMDYPDGKRYETVVIVEVRDGKIVHETDYFAEPFPAPEWRMQWVDRD